MFNLIVSSHVDNDRNGSILAARVFQYTEDQFISRFKPNGDLNVEALISLPTVIMGEGRHQGLVRIVQLTQIVKNGRYYDLSYVPYPHMPKLTNADISALSAELNLDEWEFGTNHWAIKNRDLFQVLVSYQAQQTLKPSVFQLSDKPINPNLISIMMPFSPDFEMVYLIVKTAVEAEGYECRRADDFWNNPHVMQDVIELLCTSKVIISDLSGKNPNVFYETGIAHTIGKEVILITQSQEHVPFDISSLRYIHYLKNQQGCDKLAADILSRLQTLNS